ncbi:MAG: HPr family phosphocarrier protein [Actinomyces sp.]|nr:HPr family phosphocarrier protein [Actinomyces sp.]MDN6429549.1 HPr family phosphocarrier protein [Propionibacterium sp.]MDN6566243.1 HPr family phosphocarrier protein [Actinomyces sp.]MDN6794461.1 HPr family phosphocarrier protein [Propionibacterium sp.]
MATRTVKVGAKVGLHARPAATIAEAAAKLGPEVLLSVPGGEPVDASSVMMIMTLGAGHGEEVVVESEDEEALDTIAKLIESDLDA